MILILQVCAEFTNFEYGSDGHGWEVARRLAGYLMPSDCNHITSNSGASQYGGCSWYTDATGMTPSKLFQGMDYRHHLL